MSFVDARRLEKGAVIEADVCIVGAGAAGIALAVELADSPLSVAILESGGLRYRHGPQHLAMGENIGLRSYPLAFSRFRRYGGSITRWAGKGRPFEPIDLEERPWIPESGWPFDRAHLEPYYLRAQEIMGLGPFEYDGKKRGEETRRFLPIDEGPFETKMFEIASPLEFSRTHEGLLRRAENVRVYLNATAAEIELARGESRVGRLCVKTLNGKEMWAKGNLFILAGGGIENPRILLASDAVRPGGVGNDRGLVGRYFTDHPMFYCGWFEPADGESRDSIHVESRGMSGSGDLRYGVFALSEETLRKEKLNNCSVYFVPRAGYKTGPEYFSPAGRSLVHLVDVAGHTDLPDGELGADLRRVLGGWREVSVILGRRFAELFRPDRRLALRAQLEATPCAESRVTLLAKRDRTGMRRAAVDWRMNRDDLRGLRRLLELMSARFERSSAGRLHVDLTATEGEWPDSMASGKHHMGTTRMHVDPRRGVVDEQCRVHGVANLYVAGSSVFPTGGYANPTITIVALAVRLADRVKEVLAGGASLR